MKFSVQTKRKLLKVMQISMYQIILAFILVSIASANTSKAQQLLKKKCSIKTENQDLLKTMEVLEKEANVHFMYPNDVIDSEVKTSLHFKNTRLDKILNTLFEPLNIKYEIEGNDIILKRKQKSRASLQKDIEGAAFVARPISGVINDENGQPVLGATVSEKGTTNGTTTDADGKFSLNVASDSSVIQITYIGYLTQEIQVGSKSSFTIALAPDVKALEEVVIVGYGEVKKSDLTGVVAVVEAKTFNKGAIASPDQLIVGKIAGVQITPGNGGDPGGQSFIRIRGGTSINAGNEPLYVIDGVPIDNSAFNNAGSNGRDALNNNGRNPLNFINPNDIETFTVLKDASAAAIYGSRGANGVIIITTKRGNVGTPVVNYDAFYAVGTVRNKLDLMNADEFRKTALAQDAANGSTISNYLGNANTDWLDQISRTAISSSHNLAYSGGKDKTSYRISLGYQENQGLIKNNNNKRTSFSLNYTTQAYKDRLNVKVSLKGAYLEDKFGAGLNNAIQFNPTQPVYDANSTWGGYYEQVNPLATKNPVAENTLINAGSKSFRSLGNVNLDYKFTNLIPGLSANLNTSYDINNGEYKQFIPTYLRTQITNPGQINYNNLNRTSLLLESYLNYKRDFKSIMSTVDLTAGYSYQNFNTFTNGYGADSLITNALGLYSSPVARKTRNTNESFVENRLISFYGRLNYAFKNKYLLTITLRNDGSTRFAANRRTAWFPSAALAWKIIDEPFMNGLQNTLSDLKLRVGLGITGNQEIGDYRYLQTFQFSDVGAQYQFSSLNSTLRPNAYDPNLKWEQTTQFNVGLDYGFFKNRISGSLEYYYKSTSDLLFTVNVPAGNNLSNQVLTNIGRVSNQGVEFNINAVAVRTQKFNWNINFNAAYNRNNIEELAGSQDPNFVGYQVGGIAGGVGNNIQLLKVGEAANSFYVYKQKYNSDGTPVNTAFPNSVEQQIDQYEDINGDGRITPDKDRVAYKQPAPLVILGMTQNFNFANFDLAFTLRSNLGGYNYNNIASQLTNYQALTNIAPINLLNEVNTTKFTNPQYFSSYYVQNASFLRMDNITLGYTLPQYKSLKLRLYATATNLFVITPFTGLDPEIGGIVNVAGTARPTFGIDNNIAPRMRTFTFGLNLTF